jgi:hypothetical protein
MRSFDWYSCRSKNLRTDVVSCLLKRGRTTLENIRYYFNINKIIIPSLIVQTTASFRYKKGCFGCRMIRGMIGNIFGVIRKYQIRLFFVRELMRFLWKKIRNL